VITYGWGSYIIPNVEIEVKKTADTPFWSFLKDFEWIISVF
jgi:hypothetical protein